MIPVYQIPRNTLLLLLFTQVVVCAPHLFRLPWWLSALLAVAMLWRIQVFRGRWSLPGFWPRVMLVGMVFGGLLLSFPLKVTLEGLVALLLCGYALKLIEMFHKRDALIIVFLSYFVVITQFLFEQELLYSMYGIACLYLVLAAQVALFYTARSVSIRHIARIAAGLFLQALPMMVVFFLVFPRMGALWAIPQQQFEARTGITDRLSPGLFDELMLSGEPAFRVTFDGETPPNDQLYWRGIVLSQFDGKAWQQSSLSRSDREADFFGGKQYILNRTIDRSAGSYNYQVILEPHGRTWLFALDTPEAQSGGAGVTPDFSLKSQDVVTSRKEYRVNSWKKYTLDTELNALSRKTNLYLPPNGNPRSRALAEQLLQQSADPAEYVKRILALYHEKFVYTLSPKKIDVDNDAIDGFMFDTHEGYCEHFASSLAFMLRAAGIPARVVAGYQGGEMNPLENYMLVYQYNAHAWVEMWREGAGWQRIDPVMSVAPERIRRGFDAVFRKDQLLAGMPLSLSRFRNVDVINWFRMELDRANYLWAIWILNYNMESQGAFLAAMLHGTSAWKLAVMLLGVMAVPCGVMLLLLYYRQWKHQALTPLDRLYVRFTKRLVNLGAPARKPGEPPLSYAQRVAQQLPKKSQALLVITEEYARLAYRVDAKNVNEKSLMHLRKMVRTLH